MEADLASRITPARIAATRALAEPRGGPDGGEAAWLAAAGPAPDLLRMPLDGSGPPVVVGPEAPLAGAGGYGGGVWAWAGPDRIVAVAADGRLVACDLPGGPVRVLVADGRASSPAVSPDGGWVACAVDREDACDVVVVPVDGSGPPVAVSAADYAWDPAWSPDGRTVVWHEWDLPAMSWDASRIALAARDGDAWSVPEVVAGGAGVQVGQPRFSPDGRALAYVCDLDGWLRVWTAARDGSRARVLVDEPHEHAEPAWGPGQRSFAWSPDGRAIAFTRNEDGFGRLAVASVRARRARDVARAWHRALDWGPAGILAVRSGARTPPQVVLTDPASGARRVLAEGAHGALLGTELPEPEPVTWRNGRTTVRGLLFRPPAGALGRRRRPPLVVDVHGGPTSEALADWQGRTAHRLARGWAVLRPNPRGSTGGGRAYAQALQGGWGEADVEDVAAGIRAAGRQGWASADHVAVEGGSSGGLTALLVAARHPELVHACVSIYGVTDLFDLAATTHRFESRYLDGLVGDPVHDAARYRDRSPITHAAAIRAPLLVLQGDEDKVVPPAQAEALVRAVRAAGGTVEHHVYAAEGHGWRRPDTIVDAITRTHEFLERHVLGR